MLAWSLAAVWGQEPTRALTSGELADAVKGKPGPKDKKLPEKEKDKKPPEVAVAPPVSLPDARLSSLPRTLPLAPEMLGDQPPLRVPLPVLPLLRAGGAGLGAGAAGRGAIVLPGTRGFKVADNGSPRPQDRVFVGFQYYDDLYGSTNRASGANIGAVSVLREYLGVEKSFLDGAASVELRLPMNTLHVNGNADLNGSHTAVGDLSVVLRYALYRDVACDNYLTAGLAVTTPTGPSTVGGIDVPGVTHTTILQPFIGYLWNHGDFYLQGFTAVDISADRRDVTLLYNDVGFGYFVYRTPDASRFLTAFAPSFEVHVENPLNHRSNSIAGNPVTFVDEVNLGLVGNFEFFNRVRFSAGAVTPVTGPRSFNVEGIVQLRVRY